MFNDGSCRIMGLNLAMSIPEFGRRILTPWLVVSSSGYNYTMRSNEWSYNDLLDCCVMLLIACENVRHEWTLAWKEADRNIQGLCVPKFTFSLAYLWVDLRLLWHIVWLTHWVRLKLEQEAKLCWHAKVGHRQERDLYWFMLPQNIYLFKYRVTCELHLNWGVGIEVMNSHRGNLHDVANVQKIQPLALIQISQKGFHIELRFIWSASLRN